MNKEYSDYLKFIDDALKLAKSLPKYFSKFSNKIYNNHQKFAIYVLMQKLKTTTRGICSILRASYEMRLVLGLSRIPVHSTIIRFVKRINRQIHNVLCIPKAHTVAVDATGFELESKSYYYRILRQSNRRQKTKKFMKLSAAVDVKSKKILSFKLRKSRANDTRDFPYLLRNLDVEIVLADKGYDSRFNRKLVFEKQATPIFLLGKALEEMAIIKKSF